MDMTQKPFNLQVIVRPVVNLLLILTTMLLGFITLFAVQEILVAIAAHLVIASTDDVTVQQVYIIGMVRNFWILIGGCILLTYAVICVDYYTRHLKSPRISKLLLWTLLGELLLIGLSRVI